MITRGKKYTALEIVTEAAFEPIEYKGETYEGESLFGKFALNIGGIAGIVDPSRKIIVEGESPLVVTVGDQTREIEVVDEEKEA